MSKLITQVDRRFLRKGWYLDEIHLLSCWCSCCKKATASSRNGGKWAPTLRYWLAGWWVLFTKGKEAVRYRRVTL